MKGKSPKTFTIVFFTNTTDKPRKVVLRGSMMFSSMFVIGVLILLGTSVMVDYVQLLLEKTKRTGCAWKTSISKSNLKKWK